MNLAKEIAELCWYYDAWAPRHRVWYYDRQRRGPQGLALHLKIGEDEVRAIMDSSEYLEAVEHLMRTGRSPADLKKWIQTYKDMPSRFGKRMGLSEADVSKLIEKVSP